MGYKESFIELMIESGVLTFGDFITKSGRNSPYFKYGKLQDRSPNFKAEGYYAQCIVDSGEEFSCLFGPAKGHTPCGRGVGFPV